jgi:hypothetical protein
MNCAYHTHNAAVVNCNGCGKSLCPACDHRIKGFPYCQDCIVAGVELLRNKNQAIYVPIVKKQTSPLLAALLSLFCPGLGAAYNGQTSKALIHFVVFIGLFQMAIISGGSPFFVLGFIGMWLFAALDSWRTAQSIRSGITPNNAEDVLMQRFSGNTKLWGIVLTVIGVSFLLQRFFGLQELMNFILPVLLIGLGLYLLRNFIFQTKNNEQTFGDYPNHTDDPSFANAIDNRGFRGEDFDLSNEYPTQIRAKTWKNR